MLDKLSIRAFKSLREFTINPSRVNLLIGANGTGKSNFADLVAFMATLSSLGLSGTIKHFGGLRQVRTRQPGAPSELKVEFHLGENPSRGIQEVHYCLALAPSAEIKVQSEILQATLYKRLPPKQGVPHFDTAQPIKLRYRRQGNRVTEWSTELGTITEFDDEKELLLASYGRLGELRTISDYLSSWRVYNIDATMVKQSIKANGYDLSRYGTNMVSFVARMLQNPSIRPQFLQDLRLAVPYIQDIQPERVLTTQTLRFSESDSGAEFQLPEMSDGTIRLLALLAILRQPVPPAVMVIEEPENALHAVAIHHLLEVARSVTVNKQFPSQIFFTSHSNTVLDEILSIEAMQATQLQTACFITQRKPHAPAIVEAPATVLGAIRQNLGRPSDFWREGSFEDEPYEPTFEILESEE